MTTKTLDWVLDQDGDLILVVGIEPPRSMIVDSRVLCRSSSVFSRMLKGPFVESQSDSQAWEVKLPDDNPQALLIVMDIIHNLYKHTPAEPTLDTLCHILSLTNKYDMAKSLRPVAYTWLKHAKREMTKPLQGREAYLFVAYELGDVQMFHQIALKIATECTVDREGQMLAVDGQSRLNDQEFVKRIYILDAIQNYRLMHLAHIQSTCQRYLHSLATDVRGGLKKDRQSVQNCRNELIGHILRQARLRQIARVFLPTVDDLGVGWRTNDIVKKIRLISARVPRKLLTGCDYCGQNMADGIKEEHNPLAPPASSYHISYMLKQADATQFRIEDSSHGFKRGAQS
ncbi:hypothetical protein E4U21_004783 [Claviceps maximensis]|nr:hypothetical protein E4U21_004783 [Claviceps maximensis]